MINHDTEAVVAINTNGLYVIDPLNVVVLLGKLANRKSESEIRLFGSSRHAAFLKGNFIRGKKNRIHH